MVSVPVLILLSGLPRPRLGACGGAARAPAVASGSSVLCCGREPSGRRGGRGDSRAILALALIASERLDRTREALLGAVLVLLTPTIDQHAAIAAIDWNTRGLLVGMMIVVRVTEPTGAYTWVAIRAGQHSKGRPFAVVLALAVTTALLSAFRDNLTTVLLMVPSRSCRPTRSTSTRSRW